MHFEKTIEIEAPPETVWEVVADIERWPGWTESIKRVEVVRGPLGPNAVYRLDVRGTRRSDWAVTGWDPGRRFSWRTKIQGVTCDAAHEIEPAGAGARLRLTLDYSGFMAKLFAPMIGRTSKQNLDMESAGMKRAAEMKAREKAAT
ncbi:MAG: SRPBCC family protein [Hyphomicrobiales bacterium]